MEQYRTNNDIEDYNYASGRVFSAEAFALAPEEEDKQDWKKTLLQLNEFSFLKEDWDGYGSAAPTPVLVSTATEFLSRLQKSGEPPPVRILPTQTGGFLIEWQEPGYYRE